MLFFLLEKHHFPFFLISPFDAYLALPVLIQIFFCFKTTTGRLYKRDEARSPLVTCWGNSGKRVKRWWYYMSARWWRLNTGRSSDFLREILYLNFYVKCSNLYISWLKLKEKTKLWAKTWILQNNRLKCLSWPLNAFSSSLEFFADHLPAWANCLTLSGWGKVLRERLRINSSFVTVSLFYFKEKLFSIAGRIWYMPESLNIQI